jgi:hypothetical protein
LSSVLLRIATAPRPRPSEWRPKLSSRFDDLVVRCLSIDPERRFQTVDSLLSEFRRACGVPDGGARPSREFLTEIITVKSSAPQVKEDRTKPERPVEESRNVWRIGGINTDDQAATTMMKEAEDVDETVPKLNITSPLDADSGVTIGVNKKDTILFEAPLPRRPNKLNGAVEVSATMREEPSDPSYTQRGQLTDAHVTASNPRVKAVGATNVVPIPFHQAAADPTSEGLMNDPNATALSEVADAVHAPSGPNPPATELMYALPDVQKLDNNPEHSGDQTPRRLGFYMAPPPAMIAAAAPTPAPGVTTKPEPSSTDAEIAIDRDAHPILAAFVGVGRAIMRHRLAIVGLFGMVLAFIIGIMLARWAAQEVRPAPVITVPVDATKKSEATAPPIEEPIAAEDPPIERPASDLMPLKPKRFPMLDGLLADVKANPQDQKRINALRDGIFAAADELPNEKKRSSIRRQAAAAARSLDVDGLEAAIARVRRNSPE